MSTTPIPQEPAVPQLPTSVEQMHRVSPKLMVPKLVSNTIWALIVLGFLGFAWFPIDLNYRVVGRFIKDAEPRKVSVLNTYGDVDEFSTDGVVEFALLGRTLRLRPFTTRPKRFYFVFRDASSGHETYGAARFLYADLADDGTVVLDFNQAYNPPCSFNPYTTCPIPLRENELPLKVLAGEKDYPVHVPLRHGGTS